MIPTEDIMPMVKNTIAASVKRNTHGGCIGWSSCDNICMDMYECLDLCEKALEKHEKKRPIREPAGPTRRTKRDSRPAASLRLFCMIALDGDAQQVERPLQLRGAADIGDADLADAGALGAVKAAARREHHGLAPVGELLQQI